MIDTVRFKVHVNSRVFDSARGLSSKQNVAGTELISWFTPIRLPSSDRNINIFGSENRENLLFIEFNPAKIANDTNNIDNDNAVKILKAILSVLF